MKKIMIVALCLVLALTLVACAKDDKDKPNTDLPTDSQPNTAPGNGTNGNGATNGGTVTPGGDITDDSEGNTVSPGTDTVLPNDGTANGGAQSKARSRSSVTSPNVGGDVFGYRADGMATWEQMLDNGRVRDTDGFLQDGENASWT